MNEKEGVPEVDERQIHALLSRLDLIPSFPLPSPPSLLPQNGKRDKDEKENRSGKIMDMDLDIDMDMRKSIVHGDGNNDGYIDKNVGGDGIRDRNANAYKGVKGNTMKIENGASTRYIELENSASRRYIHTSTSKTMVEMVETRDKYDSESSNTSYSDTEIDYHEKNADEIKQSPSPTSHYRYQMTDINLNSKDISSEEAALLCRIFLRPEKQNQQRKYHQLFALNNKDKDKDKGQGIIHNEVESSDYSRTSVETFDDEMTLTASAVTTTVVNNRTNLDCDKHISSSSSQGQSQTQSQRRDQDGVILSGALLFALSTCCNNNSNSDSNGNSNGISKGSTTATLYLSNPSYKALFPSTSALPLSLSSWYRAQFKSLEMSINLQTLKLSGNSLGDEGTVILSQALKYHSSLRTLDLGFNGIGDEGAEGLKDILLPFHPLSLSLQTLYLSGNKIGPHGGLALAKGIQYNNTLESLHLSGNRIGEAAVPLGDALLTNGGLKKLYLAGNKMEAQWGAYFLSALSENICLDSLYLMDNGLQDHGILHLAKTIEKKKNFKVLELSFNQITQLGIRYLAAAFQSPCPESTTENNRNNENRNDNDNESVMNTDNGNDCDNNDNDTTLTPTSTQTPIESGETTNHQIKEGQQFGYPSLEELYLDNNNLKEEGFESLAVHALPHLSSLHTLNIGYNGILKSHGIKALSNYLILPPTTPSPSTLSPSSLLSAPSSVPKLTPSFVTSSSVLSSASTTPSASFQRLDQFSIHQENCKGHINQLEARARGEERARGEVENERIHQLSCNLKRLLLCGTKLDIQGCKYFGNILSQNQSLEEVVMDTSGVGLCSGGGISVHGSGHPVVVSEKDFLPKCIDRKNNNQVGNGRRESVQPLNKQRGSGSNSEGGSRRHTQYQNRNANANRAKKDLGDKGEGYIVRGILQNSHTRLRKFTGFQLAPVFKRITRDYFKVMKSNRNLNLSPSKPKNGDVTNGCNKRNFSSPYDNNYRHSSSKSNDDNSSNKINNNVHNHNKSLTNSNSNANSGSKLNPHLNPPSLRARESSKVENTLFLNNLMKRVIFPFPSIYDQNLKYNMNHGINGICPDLACKIVLEMDIYSIKNELALKIVRDYHQSRRLEKLLKEQKEQEEQEIHYTNNNSNSYNEKHEEDQILGTEKEQGASHRTNLSHQTLVVGVSNEQDQVENINTNLNLKQLHKSSDSNTALTPFVIAIPYEGDLDLMNSSNTTDNHYSQDLQVVAIEAEHKEHMHERKHEHEHDFVCWDGTSSMMTTPVLPFHKTSIDPKSFHSSSSSSSSDLPITPAYGCEGATVNIDYPYNVSNSNKKHTNYTNSFHSHSTKQYKDIPPSCHITMTTSPSIETKTYMMDLLEKTTRASQITTKNQNQKQNHQNS